MKQNIFFLYCAGTSLEILEKCPDSDRIKQESIGIAIFLTATLALISSYLAFGLITDSIWLKTFGALIWSFMIFNLDRMIVSSLRRGKGKWNELIQTLPRIALAFIIALAISKPLEIQIFKSEIEEALFSQMNASITSNEEKAAKELSQLETRENKAKENLAQFFNLKEAYYQEYKCECDGTCGTGKVGRGNECLRKKEKYEAIVLEYQFLKSDTEVELAKIGLEKEFLHSKLIEENEDIKSNFSRGIYSQLAALSSLDSWVPWVVTLLLILVELAPLFTKIISPVGPYDVLLNLHEENLKLNFVKMVNKEGKGLQKKEQRISDHNLDEAFEQKVKTTQKLYNELKHKVAKDFL